MPLAHVEWFMKQSAHDSGKIQAQQCCTYYSVTNVNKTNYPFLSSYEQEQTWTLTRTMSNDHKHYQSSIENIYLTKPTSALKTKYVNYENINIEKDRSISLFPSLHRSLNTGMNSVTHQEQKTLPIKTITNSNSNPNLKRFRPMRVIHANGELVVRI